MANPNFDGIYSTNNIWRDNDETRCLTDDLDAIEADIQALQDAEPETYTHPDTHPASMITGLAPVATSGSYNDLANKPTIPAAYTHPSSHPMSMITGLDASLTAKADLVDGKVPSAQLPSFVDDVLEYAAVTNFPATGEAGKIYVATSTNKSYRWSGSTYVEIAGGVALGETSATAYRGDRGKIAYDHSQNGDVHVTAAQKTAWDSKAPGNHGHSYNDLTDKPTIPTIPSSLPANGGNADTVDGKNASDFAAANHTHTAAALLAMAEALFGTNANGGSEYSYTSGDVLKAISAYGPGFHTVYAAAGCSTNPDSSESYRYFIHKTGDTIGWILAWGSEGSLYTNYQYGDNQFKGWRCLYDASPAPLWSGGANGGYFMTAGHTITPSKKMSECRNGWLLLWSDYDTGANAQANNTDFCVTLIPKRAYTGQVWNGAMWYCDVPTYAAGTATDSETRVIKVLQVYDAKLIGTENNAAAPRNDVVLRAVYEW